MNSVSIEKDVEYVIGADRKIALGSLSIDQRSETVSIHLTSPHNKISLTKAEIALIIKFLESCL